MDPIANPRREANQSDADLGGVGPPRSMSEQTPPHIRRRNRQPTRPDWVEASGKGDRGDIDASGLKMAYRLYYNPENDQRERMPDCEDPRVVRGEPGRPDPEDCIRALRRWPRRSWGYLTGHMRGAEFYDRISRWGR